MQVAKSDDFKRLNGKILFLGISVCKNHIGSFFPNHDARRIRVSGGNSRHDWGVSYPEPIDPVHPQSWVHNRCGIARRPHPACAHVVIDGEAEMSYYALPVRVAERREVTARRIRFAVKLCAKFFEVFWVAEVEAVLDAGDHCLNIMGIIVKVSLKLIIKKKFWQFFFRNGEKNIFS